MFGFSTNLITMGLLVELEVEWRVMGIAGAADNSRQETCKSGVPAAVETDIQDDEITFLLEYMLL